MLLIVRCIFKHSGLIVKISNCFFIKKIAGNKIKERLLIYLFIHSQVMQTSNYWKPAIKRKAKYFADEC